jgi:FMN phosphatase YigB (HAD superfamily)
MTVFSHVKAIIWDFDGTKTRYRQNVSRLFAEAVCEALNKTALESGKPLTMSYEEIVATHEPSYKKHGFSFTIAAHEMQLDPLRVHHHLHRQLDIRKVCEPVPGLREAFADVAQTHRHVILTHADADWVAQGMEMNGIHFPSASIITLPDFGFANTKDMNGKSYELALEKLETAPEETAFVDDTDRNHLHAHNIGITTVLIGNTPSQQPYIQHTYPDAAHFLRALTNG